MQNFLTNFLEVIVVWQLVTFCLSCAFTVKSRLNNSQTQVAQNFDAGVKAIMACEPEEVEGETGEDCLRISNHPVEELTVNKVLPVTPTQSVFANMASMRSYIKADAERQQKIEAFLLLHKCDRRRKADLARAIKAVG